MRVPPSALDLPLKVLVRADGVRVVVEYNDTRWLAARHGVPEELVGVLAGVAGLVGGVVGSTE